MEFKFERLEFHRSRFEDGEEEKEKKIRIKKRKRRLPEENLIYRRWRTQYRDSTAKNALAGSLMTAVASKRRVAEMSVDEPQ